MAGAVTSNHHTRIIWEGAGPNNVRPCSARWVAAGGDSCADGQSLITVDWAMSDCGFLPDGLPTGRLPRGSHLVNLNGTVIRVHEARVYEIRLVQIIIFVLIPTSRTRLGSPSRGWGR